VLFRSYGLFVERPADFPDGRTSCIGLNQRGILAGLQLIASGDLPDWVTQGTTTATTESIGATVQQVWQTLRMNKRLTLA
jgi:hypothetical protein